MFIETGTIGIDTENSSTYGSIYVTGGGYKGPNVLGVISPMVIQYACDNFVGTKNIDLYLDLVRQTVNYKEQDIPSCITGTHLGTVIVSGDGCGCTVAGFTERVDPCLKYQRAFGSGFDLGFNADDSIVNICTGTDKEFTEDMNVDYNINTQGDGIVVDNRVYGNDVTADGNIDKVDGNE